MRQRSWLDYIERRGHSAGKEKTEENEEDD